MRAWIIAQDGEPELSAIYERHYSASKSMSARAKRSTRLFCGPGQKVVLTTPRRGALFVWRNFKDKCIDARTGLPQVGVNCAVFRNESEGLSSDLIREADAIADFCWPGSRHYTYVRPEAVASRNPGYCFIRAGWSRCGRTKSGLHILERVI